MLSAETDRAIQELCSTLGAIERYFVQPLGDLRVRARQVQALGPIVSSEDAGELVTALASAVAARDALGRVREALVDWLMDQDPDGAWTTAAGGETPRVITPSRTISEQKSEAASTDLYPLPNVV